MIEEIIKKIFTALFVLGGFIGTFYFLLFVALIIHINVNKKNKERKK